MGDLLNELNTPQVDADAIRNQLPFDRIIMRRGACFGPCPSYEITLSNDGWAQYVGLAFAEREGTYSGEVPLRTVVMLLLGAQKIGFIDLAGSYKEPPLIDAASTTITLVATGRGVSHQVSASTGGGPPGFWLLAKAIDAVSREVAWQPTPSTESRR